MTGYDTDSRKHPSRVAAGTDAGADSIDPVIACDACDAVCCRLTVVLMAEDRVPGHLTDHTTHGLHVMARDEDGWCVAVDPLRMCCSIYDQRPTICREFAMGSASCRDVRDTYREQNARGIPLTMY